jgi:hypothetical protein
VPLDRVAVVWWHIGIGVREGSARRQRLVRRGR